MHTHDYNMFCLPSAGSSTVLYHSFKEVVPQNIKIIPIEYSGHGSRAGEALISDPSVLASQIATEIEYYSKKPFILFGHSLGAALIWKVLGYLQQESIAYRLKLIVISSRPEHNFMQHMRYQHDQSDQEIIVKLKNIITYR